MAVRSRPYKSYFCNKINLKIKVAIFEDNKNLREGFKDLIESDTNYELVGMFANANSIAHDILQCKPDVVLMDIQMPGVNGIEAVKILNKEYPEIKVVIQTVFEDNNHILEAICNGASGYLLKKSSPLEYLNAISDVMSGGAPMTNTIAKKVLNIFRSSQEKKLNVSFNLSDREIEILDYLVKGLSYKMIADKCDITYNTVRFHIKNIYSKLHVDSMTEAVTFAIRNNLV